MRKDKREKRRDVSERWCGKGVREMRKKVRKGSEEG